MSKKKTIEQRLSKAYNRDLFSGYLLYLQNDKIDENGARPKPSTCRTYQENNIKFVEYIDKNNKDIKNLEVYDILTYFKDKFQSKSSTYTESNYYAVVDFLNYSNPSLTKMLDVSLIRNLTDKNDASQNQSATILTVDEIITLRNKLIETNNSVYLFTFEMTYMHGFSLDKLSKCVEKNYDFETRKFNIDGDITLVSPFIGDIIMDNPKKILKEIKPHIYSSYYFPQIGELIGKKLKWLDVIKTREETFFKCPVCPNLFPPDRDYWTFAVKNDDVRETHWIVCRNHCNEDGDDV